MPEIFCKSLHATIWRHSAQCSVWLEPEQRPLSQTGQRFRTASLHRIWFTTCRFFPMPYFYSETNAWSKGWVKWWALLCLGTSSSKNQRNFMSHNLLSATCFNPKFTNSKDLFDSSTTSVWQLSNSGSTFSSSEPVAAHSNCSWLGKVLFCACLSDQPAVQSAVPRAILGDDCWKHLELASNWASSMEERI